MSNKNKLVLIDSHAIIHRAYHAFPDTLRTRDGEHINAVYGFTKILLEVIDKFKPEYIVCAFDSKGPTFRHDKFEEYKATRKKADPELIDQFSKVKEVVKAFNIPILEKQGYEADDILGCIVSRDKLKDISKVIVTGDHDILQLIVYPNTKVYISGNAFSKSKLYDAEQVKERYKFGPEYIVDYKALRGDSSDNIPGVRGIGEKTATKLIKGFGHLDEIYNGIEEITPAGVKKKLEDNKETAYLSKELATIDCVHDIEFELQDSEFVDFSEQEVKDVFMKFSFSSLLNKIPDSKHAEASNYSSPSLIKEEEFNYIHLVESDEIDEFLSELSKQEVFAYDTETTGLSYMNAKVIGMSVSWKAGEAYYIDMDNDNFNENHVKKIKQIFEDPNVKKVAHNLKFDVHMLQNKTVKGIELDTRVENFYFDTMIAQYILTGSQGRNGLKSLAFSECGLELSHLEDLWAEVVTKTKKSYTDEEVEFMMLELDKKKLSYYAAQDADATWRLYEIFVERFKGKENLSKLFYEIEMPLIEILFEIERKGIHLDIEYLQAFGDKLENQLNEIKDEIYEEIGHEFNIGSSKQVGEVLFDELGLPGGRKTKTGAWQTNEKVLLEYQEVHPVISMILEYREISKLISTYVTSLINEVDASDDRIHTTYNQTIASTGRLSSSKPNLQNIPVSTEIGRKVRRAFLADRGKTLVSFDISQQELRILAHLSKEEKLIEAFKNGTDIHKNTAAMLFNTDETKITQQQRSMGKTLNYSLIYGISSYGLSDRLKISVNEAQDLIDGYFQIYPKVKTYFDNILDEAKKTGRVETLYGRYRNASDLNSSNFRVRSATEREVINFPIQGTASDLMKIAMLKVHDYILGSKKYKKLNAHILLQVHDELVFEVNESGLLNDFCLEIQDIMTHIGQLSVPMDVEYHIGKNWAELK